MSNPDIWEQSSSTVIAVEEAPPERKREVRKTPKKKPQSKKEPNYHVVLWNDDDHSPQYVVNMMLEVFNHSVSDALRITSDVHVKGLAITTTCHKELAELKCEQIRAYGGDDSLPSCPQYSMHATIEPADDE